jgi:hypothetical protein
MGQCSVLTIHPIQLPASSNRNPPISPAFRETPATKNTSAVYGLMRVLSVTSLIGPLWFGEDQSTNTIKTHVCSLDSCRQILFTTPYSVVNTICGRKNMHLSHGSSDSRPHFLLGFHSRFAIATRAYLYKI